MDLLQHISLSNGFAAAQTERTFASVNIFFFSMGILNNGKHNTMYLHKLRRAINQSVTRNFLYRKKSYADVRLQISSKDIVLIF